MADRLDSERLRGFCDGLMDVQTDICDSRVAFATEYQVCNYSKHIKYYVCAIVMQQQPFKLILGRT